MPDPTVAELRAALDVALAQRDRALTALDDLERMATKTGGHMTHDEQKALREARAELVASGKRKSDAPPVWRDRR